MTGTSPPTSLADRLSARLRGGDWRVGAAVAVALALVPLAVAGAATVMALRVEDRVAARKRQDAVGLARVAARKRLQIVLAQPGVGATLTGLARALPSESTVRRVARDEGGVLTVEVATSDPDRLRAALRRDPVTSRLRDVAQQGGLAGLIVTLEARP
jgi:hypothetical protein